MKIETQHGSYSKNIGEGKNSFDNIINNPENYSLIWGDKNHPKSAQSVQKNREPLKNLFGGLL